MLKTLLLNHNIVQSELSDQAFAVYLSLTDMVSEYEDKVYVSLAQIHFKLTGNPKMTRSERDSLLMGLDQLNEEKIISICDYVGKSEFIIDISQLKLRQSSTESYDIVYLDEIKKVMNINDINNLLLLRYFCVAVSTFDYKHKIEGKNRAIGFLSTDRLAEICNIHIQSAFKYNRILEANELLYFCHNRMRNRVNNGFASVNSYCRYKNKEFIENLEE